MGSLFFELELYIYDLFNQGRRFAAPFKSDDFSHFTLPISRKEINFEIRVEFGFFFQIYIKLFLNIPTFYEEGDYFFLRFENWKIEVEGIIIVFYRFYFRRIRG